MFLIERFTGFKSSKRTTSLPSDGENTVTRTQTVVETVRGLGVTDGEKPSQPVTELDLTVKPGKRN